MASDISQKLDATKPAHLLVAGAAKMIGFQEIVNRQRAYFNTDITKSFEWRVEQLDRLAKMLKENAGANRRRDAEDRRPVTASATIGLLRNVPEQMPF